MILVAGGCGYIGSHVVVELLNLNYDVIILDNLSTSNISAINNIGKITGKVPIFFKGCISDVTVLDEIFDNYAITNVIHLAGYKSVAESNIDPEKYLSNNIDNSIMFLDHLKRKGIKNIIFSSSATVYAASDSPLKETDPLNPISIYGKTKLVIEQYLQRMYDNDHSFNITILRYFNPYGRHYSNLLIDTGQDNVYPNIENAIENATKFYIYGNDYPTPDGTAIRDYINVQDLAQYHVKFLYCPGFNICNIGTGVGKSVMQIVKEFPQLKYAVVERRIGDVPKLVCSIEKLKKMFK